MLFVKRGNINKLMIAARSGDLSTLVALLDKRIRVNTQDSVGMTALMYAALGDHTGTVRFLLDRGADTTNIRNKNGSTALMLAAMKGHNDTLRTLLRKFTDIDARDNEGLTAMQYAAYEGHYETVEILMSQGAKV